MLFFVGGSDTITLTLTWTAYSLALHPECQKKVLKEIDSAVKQNGVTYESLKDMPYLEAVINEALRMYAPEPFLVRRCTQEISVAGIQVRPGMSIEIPMEGIHRDAEFFPNPTVSSQKDSCLKTRRLLFRTRSLLSVPGHETALARGWESYKPRLHWPASSKRSSLKDPVKHRCP
uniref:Putative cytochrome p450 cyp3/cyp5/cyp6/cyp9 subfamily protein n=1 Tax=Ixodes ricinus TaxID=34613 RepID=A0A6B0UYA5_IXORI